VLQGVDHPLADAYAAGPATAAPRHFIGLCDDQWPAIVDTMRHRRVQTNECGRSGPIALALTAVTDVVGPLALLVDAGASAGLNLLYDRYCLDYGVLGRLGDPASPVHVTCDVIAGGARLPEALPAIERRVGLDRDPIDVTDADDRRWLLACVWPDTGRSERTAAALRIAAEHPPVVQRGDMIDDLASTIDSLGVDDGPVCVMTSWAAGYLSPPARDDFAAVLTGIGMRRDVVWLSLEMAGVVDVPAAPDGAAMFGVEPSVVGLTRFRDGTRQGRVLGLVHPHGRAFQWVFPH
jgi:hypothetical protein